VNDLSVDTMENPANSDYRRMMINMVKKLQKNKPLNLSQSTADMLKVK